MRHPPFHKELAGLVKRAGIFRRLPMISRKKAVFDPVEAGSLRAVFLLALSGLEHTHHVSEAVMGQLCDAVFEAYIDSKFPPLPLSSSETEDLAVLSIDLLNYTSPELLVLKR